ncbi:MAG: hypothetical protein KF805_06490 [Phycisphaeraceae bacterium]|nr:hypothetical protein [Phycisphaeraceae bacterium]
MAVLITCCLALVKLLKSRGTDESKSAVDFGVRVLCFYVCLGLVSWLWLNAGRLVGWP